MVNLLDDKPPRFMQKMVGFAVSQPVYQIPDTPCMEYFPTFTINFKPNVGKYTIVTWMVWEWRLDSVPVFG